MTTENKELTAMARKSLKGNWGHAIGITVIYGIIIGFLNSTKTEIPGVDVIPGLESIDLYPSTILGFGSLVVLLITGPLTVGLVRFFINLSTGKQIKIEQLFSGFKSFISAFIAELLRGIFILLWTLLLVVPGIIAALSYSMTYYVIAEDENITGYQALMKSKKIMQGHKGKLFCLVLRFTGWFFLACLTAGIGFIFLVPYVNTTIANFYNEVKNKGIDSDT